MTLRGTACYGIRVYLKGSYLYNHVDRIDTHVISSTICVDHDLASPWPLYIEDLDGNPHEVDMAPGDLVFYESARLKHGRPHPLDGGFYAGMFVHYAPVDWPYTAADLR
jgi:prolyl 4-hydroxylase